MNYDKPIKSRSLLHNHNFLESKEVFFVAHTCLEDLEIFCFQNITLLELSVFFSVFHSKGDM